MVSTLTIRMAENKAESLKALAERRDISVNQLVGDLVTQALSAAEVETRFRTMAARGSTARGRALLDELDTYYGSAHSARPSTSGMHDKHKPLPEGAFKMPPGTGGRKKDD